MVSIKFITTNDEQGRGNVKLKSAIVNGKTEIERKREKSLIEKIYKIHIAGGSKKFNNKREMKLYLKPFDNKDSQFYQNGFKNVSDIFDKDFERFIIQLNKTVLYS